MQPKRQLHMHIGDRYHQQVFYDQPFLCLQVCPALSLPLIRRILSIFEPDEFFPDPVSPSLLAALNAEVRPLNLVTFCFLMDPWTSTGMEL